MIQPLLLTPILVSNRDIDIVRIGQFDETTVRIVIETDNPNRLYPVYGADQQSLYITSNPSFAVSNLPKGTAVGYIRSIRVSEDRGIGTIVRVESSTPIISRLRRIHNPEKVIIDMINAEPSSEDITSNIPTTRELMGVRVGQLMAGNPNSRIVLDLSNSGVQIRSNISDDGKTMEVVLKQSAIAELSSGNTSGLKVVIDPGHGGYDPGCQRDGYKEKDINLDVSKRVKVILEKAGVEVLMTRITDATLSLKERTDFTNNVNPAAFISIHTNASQSSAPEGVDSFWYTEQSKPLAKCIQNSLINRIEAIDRGIQRNMLYVIHHTNVPAALVEIGFLSNPKERAEILTNKRKQNTAQAIAEGVLQFLRSNYLNTDVQLQR